MFTLSDLQQLISVHFSSLTRFQENMLRFLYQLHRTLMNKNSRTNGNVSVFGLLLWQNGGNPDDDDDDDEGCA